MKKVSVPLSVAGINELKKSLKEYRAWQEQRARVFLERLGELGVEIASVKFSTAIYDGTNDVDVQIEERGENAIAIVATGNATLFIEFGTGIVYADNHPEAQEHGMTRGGYGAGKGKQNAWGYYGEAGTNGKEVVKNDGTTVVITHGNPANMSMYETTKELEARFKALAEEVFK